MTRKISGLSKAIYVIIKILRVLTMIGIVLMLMTASALFYIGGSPVYVKADGVASVLVDFGELGLPEYMLESIEASLGGSAVAVTEGGTVVGDMYFVGYLLVACILSAIAWYITLVFAGKTAKKMTGTYKPFSSGAGKYLVGTGISALCARVLSPLFISGAVYLAYRLGSLKLSDGLKNIPGLNDPSLLGLALGILVFVLLCRLFNYGAELERRMPEDPGAFKEPIAVSDIPEEDEKAPENGSVNKDKMEDTGEMFSGEALDGEPMDDKDTDK